MPTPAQTPQPTTAPMSDEYLNRLREAEYDYFPAGVVWKLLAEIDNLKDTVDRLRAENSNLKARPEPTQTPVPNLENAIGYAVVREQYGSRNVLDGWVYPTLEAATHDARARSWQVCALVPVDAP